MFPPDLLEKLEARILLEIQIADHGEKRELLQFLPGSLDVVEVDQAYLGVPQGLGRHFSGPGIRIDDEQERGLGHEW